MTGERTAAAMVDHFEATRLLDDAALRALLAGGRPEQRVWAAWQLSLRAGAAAPHLVQHVQGEPSAGVRRALLVVLAGHEELALLVALAQTDPSLEVRVTAISFVVRWFVAGRVPLAVIAEAYAAGPAQIRIAILGEIGPASPEALRGFITEALSDGAPDEQVEAFAAALRSAAPELHEPATRWLMTAHDNLASDVWQHLQRLQPVEVVEFVRRTTYQLRMTALAELTGFPVAALATLAIDGDPHGFKLIRERPDFHTAPPELLARALLAGCAFHFVEELTDRLAPLAVAPEALAPLMPRLRAHVRRRIAATASGHYLSDEKLRHNGAMRGLYLHLLTQLDRLA